MGPSAATLRGLVLIAMLLLPARALPQEPAEGPLATLSVQDGPALLRSLGRALGPLPEALPAEVRAGLGLAWLGLGAKTGRSPPDLVELLIPGPATLSVVAPDRRPGLLFVTRVQEQPVVDSLLDELPSLHRLWRGNVLALANEARVLDALSPTGLLGGVGTPADRAAPRLGLYVDLHQLRSLDDRGDRAVSDGLAGASRFLFGPWVRVWERAQHLGGELIGTDQGLKLTVRLDATLDGDPWQKLTVRESRAAPAPPENTIAFVSLDRRLGALFRNLGELLSEEDVAQARTFISTADRFLLGASFVNDLLGSLAEPMHLYVLDIEPRSPPSGRMPRIQLPAFALVASVPEERIGSVKKMLEQVSRTLMLVINALRSTAGQAPFRLGSETIGELTGLVAVPTEWQGPGAPPTEHGISPTLLFGKGHVILSTSREGAAAIGDSLAAGRTVELAGDHVEVRGPALARSLRRNLPVLELSRVLDEGETMAQARRFWQTALALIDAVALVRGRTRRLDGGTELELILRRR